MSHGHPAEKTDSAAGSPPTAVPELQENLRRLDRLANLGLVSASIAHEIKNGLVAINTFVAVLLEKGEDREMADMVQRELKRIDGLATQMLRFASPKPAAQTTVHVHHILDHSLRLLEHQLGDRMIVLKRDYCAIPDTVRGDESQLQQAFMNLLFNGVEAIGSNGELTVVTEITTAKDGVRQLKIHFRDTGAGITPENLPHVFKAFFTTKKNGTGLGLAICQRVTHEHGGTIAVHSQPGHGATFTVSLPVE